MHNCAEAAYRVSRRAARLRIPSRRKLCYLVSSAVLARAETFIIPDLILPPLTRRASVTDLVCRLLYPGRRVACR